LTAFGNAAGRSRFFLVEADRHCPNLFTAIVGDTSKGRKGTSWARVRRLFELADATWSENRVLGGLSSGEGMLWAVRDPIHKTEAIREKGRPTGEHQMVLEDAGIDDKRLLAMEAELASVLRVLERDGNTLSPLLRQAWDTGDLRVMTKKSPAKSTGAHVSVIGHIVKEELNRYLSSTEAGNGFANRFLWVCARRSKLLPDGGKLTDADLVPLAERLREALECAREAGEVKRTEEARKLWHDVYPELSDGAPGLLGAVTSRAEAQVTRLALIFALLDRSSVIDVVHLKAARAVWQYAADSAKYIFGDSLGDPVADQILRAVTENPAGVSKTDLLHLFKRNVKAARIEHALAELERVGRIAPKVVPAAGGRGGRNTTLWLPAAPPTSYERNEVNEQTPPE